MAKRDPNLIEYKGNPSIWVRIRRHGEHGPDKDAFWHFDFSYNAKRIRGSTGKLDHAEAVAVALARVEKELNTVPHSAAALTLQQAVNQYVETRWPDADSSNRSYLDARNRLDAFAASMGKDTSITTLDMTAATALLQGYINKRRKDKVSAQTLVNFRLVVSNFYAWLMRPDPETKRKIVGWPQNPANKEAVQTPEVEHHIAPPLARGDVQKAVEAARTSPAFPALILCLSGLRPRGATRVTWNYLDLKAKQVTVFEKGKGRTIPLGDWSVKELAWWKEQHPPTAETDLVISSHSVLYKWMRGLRKTETLKGLGSKIQLQAMRRAFISQLYEANVAPQVAAKLAGNSIPTIQKHYKATETLNAAPAANVINFGMTLVSETVSGKEKKNA